MSKLQDIYLVLTGKLSMSKLAIAEMGNQWNTENKLFWDRQINSALTAYKTLALANARLIAKLEPLYGIPEDDPARREASDKLAESVIARLVSEDIISKMTR